MAGKKSRPGARGMISLVPDLKTESNEDLAEAFIGRFMTAGDGIAYDWFAEPYCTSSGAYDLMNKGIKNTYKRFVLEAGWDEQKYFRVLCWILENKMNITSYSFDRGARLLERDRLPYGKLADLPVKVMNKIALRKRATGKGDDSEW